MHFSISQLSAVQSVVSSDCLLQHSLHSSSRTVHSQHTGLLQLQGSYHLISTRNVTYLLLDQRYTFSSGEYSYKRYPLFRGISSLYLSKSTSVLYAVCFHSMLCLDLCDLSDAVLQMCYCSNTECMQGTGHSSRAGERQFTSSELRTKWLHSLTAYSMSVKMFFYIPNWNDDIVQCKA